MRIGFLSDIHGNLEALEVALAKLDAANPDKIICIGDVVGYGADPGKCVDMVQSRADVVLAGNHDWACVGKTDITYFNKFGRKAILWTSEVLMPHHRAFLAQLQLIHTDSGWCAVHSTPHEPSRWRYIMFPADAIEQFMHFGQKLCFIGHLHIPGIFTDHGEQFGIGVAFNEERITVPISNDHRYIVNIGSVGQPRDGDTRGCVAIYDSDNKTVEFIRFFYEVPRTQEKIIAAGLPEFLAERLAQGV